MKLYYTDQGEGQAMVLLHGNGEDGTYFKNQMGYFSSEYRMIAVDTRGHGKSPRGNREFTLKQFARDLKLLLDELKLKDIILLGFSDGGNIALIFTLWHPEYVSRLILNGANLTPFGVKLSDQFITCAEYAAVSFFNMFVPSLTRKKEMLALMVKEPWIDSKRLREIKVPVLVIAGTKDMIRTGHTKHICAMIPEGHLCLIEGSHFIAEENSREFNRAVAMFLNNIHDSKDNTGLGK